MFRALSAHLQEVNDVNCTCMQPLVFSFSAGGRLVHLLRGDSPAAAHLLRSWVRIPPGAWIFVCCECRVLSGRGLCDELITRPEESYRLAASLRVI